MRRVLVAALVLSVLVSAQSATAVGPGRVVGQSTGAGEPAVAVGRASVQRPTALWVRLSGGVTGSTILVDCVRGFSTSVSSYPRSRSGTFRLPIRPAHADACDVFATVAGTTRVRLEIRAAT